MYVLDLAATPRRDLTSRWNSKLECVVVSPGADVSVDWQCILGWFQKRPSSSWKVLHTHREQALKRSINLYF
jgi:hypothetical protein